MKSTGVIRRIDELGRIVIPKEIRKNLRISDGENIEILIDSDNIVLKKFSLLGKINESACSIADAVHSVIKKDIIITDRDKVLAATGSLKKDYLDKEISDDLILKGQTRDKLLVNSISSLSIIKGESVQSFYCLYPILCDGDVVGTVIIISHSEHLQEFDVLICKLVSKFLANILED